MSAHTPGPFTIRVRDQFPWSIDTIDAFGAVAFSADMPCHSSCDETLCDVIECRNFPPKEREAASAANRRAIADETLRAAAPALLEAAQCARIKLGRYQQQHPDTCVGGVLAEYEAACALLDAAIASATGEA